MKVLLWGFLWVVVVGTLLLATGTAWAWGWLCPHSHYRRERDERGQLWLVCDHGCGKRVLIARTKQERAAYRKVRQRMAEGDGGTVTAFKRKGA